MKVLQGGAVLAIGLFEIPWLIGIVALVRYLDASHPTLLIIGLAVIWVIFWLFAIWSECSTEGYVSSGMVFGGIFIIPILGIVVVGAGPFIVSMELEERWFPIKPRPPKVLFRCRPNSGKQAAE